MTATIYTDGSCHTQLLIGAWAAIIFIDDKEVVLSGDATNTTHNRMELMAVINAVSYVQEKHPTVSTIRIISDSQYVVGLTDRSEKLSSQNFMTKKGTQISNADLVKTLLQYIATLPLSFTKIKAHQQKDNELNYNIVADKLSRSIVRKLTEKP